MDFAAASDFAYHVAPPEPDAPEPAQSVMVALHERASRLVAQAAASNAASMDALTAWREAVAAHVGREVWDRFLDFSTEQRRSNFGVGDNRPGVVSPERIAAARKTARERSLDLMRAEEVAPDVIRAVHDRAHDAVARPGKKDRIPIRVTGEAEVPAAVLEGKTNPWFVKHPPFDGYYWQYDWQKWGGTVSKLKHNNVVDYGLQYPGGSFISGQFGHESRYVNYSASDFDALFLDFLSEVGFWYKAPTPGTRNVWIKVRCPEARAAIYLDDEWGWSKSSTTMISAIRMNVVEVPGLEGKTNDWVVHVKGNPDSQWYHIDWIAPGGVLWLNFQANFPPGWVYIAIGAVDHRSCLLNDVSTAQTMDSRYVAEEVWIED